MTQLVTSIPATDTPTLLKSFRRALGEGCDWIELRLDYLDSSVESDSAWSSLQNVEPGRWIATLRSIEEGGKCGADGAERLGFVRKALRAGAGAVDIEFKAWRSISDQERAALLTGLSDTGSRLVLSWHDFQKRPDDVPSLLREMLAAHANAFVKIVWSGSSLSENLDAFEAMRLGQRRAIVIVMGERGLASRVMAGKHGAAATFCALDKGKETAPGQVTLREMLDLYRWDSIRPTTHFYGVLGDPVGHSLSPAVFNSVFTSAGIDAVYLPLLVTGGEVELYGFLRACEERAWLDAGGFSVTLPHKEAARRYVGDRADAMAARVGAVNTLAMRDGAFHGFNTDYAAVLEALCTGLNCRPGDLHGLPVDVLGAGGVSRAVVAVLTDSGGDLTIYNRSQERADSLAGEFSCRAGIWEERGRGDGRVVINCTSVGMLPDQNGTPLPMEGLARRALVFDTVYNPVETRLIREARAAGCATLCGVEMFIRQAARQYEIWFGTKPSLNDMRQTTHKHLAVPSALKDNRAERP